MNNPNIKLLLILTFISFYSRASFLPVDFCFWNENTQASCEGDNFKVGKNLSNGYFEYHRISEIYEDNPYLYYPNLKIKIIDSGYNKGHEDYHSILNYESPYKENVHGNKVSGVFSISQKANTKGIYSIVNSETNLSYFGTDESYRNLDEFRIINLSIGVTDNLNKAEKYELYQKFRTTMVNTPNTLFIFSSGNDYSNSDEYARNIQRVYNPIEKKYNYSRLPNLIVVGANGYDDKLHISSNFGEGVELTAISGVLTTAGVTADKKSQYTINDDEDRYGYGGSVADSESKFFNGTSASAPIVSGVSALLFSVDPSLTPNEVKDYLILNNKGSIVKRHWATYYGHWGEDVSPLIPILDAKAAYDALMQDLSAEVDLDIASLNSAGYSSKIDCTDLETKNPKGDDVYHREQYGDRCLFFRGNSFIIDFDKQTSTAKKLYYGDKMYDEYMLFRMFKVNINSAKNDEIWKNGYGVTLNSKGNVGLVKSDLCPKNSDTCLAVNEFTSSIQCKNLAKSISVSRTIENDFYTNFNEDLNQCEYISKESPYYFSYNQSTGEVSSDLLIDKSEDVIDRFIYNVKRANDSRLIREKLGIASVVNIDVIGGSKRDQESADYGFIRSKSGCELFFEDLTGEKPSDVGYEAHYWNSNLCNYEELNGVKYLEYYRPPYRGERLYLRKGEYNDLEWHEIDFSKVNNYEESNSDQYFKRYPFEFFVNEVEIRTPHYSGLGAERSRLTKYINSEYPKLTNRVFPGDQSHSTLHFPKTIRKIEMDFTYSCSKYILGYISLGYQNKEGMSVNIDPNDPKNNICSPSEFNKYSERTISMSIPFGTKMMYFTEPNAFISKIRYAY